MEPCGGVRPVRGRVGPEGEHGERAVGLVALLPVHGRAPEVVEEEVEQRRGGAQVPVVAHGGDVVEHEAAAEAVPVAQPAQGDQQQPAAHPRRIGRIGRRLSSNSSSSSSGIRRPGGHRRKPSLHLFSSPLTGIPNKQFPATAGLPYRPLQFAGPLARQPPLSLSFFFAPLFCQSCVRACAPFKSSYPPGGAITLPFSSSREKKKTRLLGVSCVTQ